MKWSLADNTNPHSMAYQFRMKRFLFFRSLLNQLPRPVSILDIGGTQEFWKGMGFFEEGVSITLLNLDLQDVSAPFTSVKGDATDLSKYADRSFDIVYSNSVIEHLFTYEAQKKMAAEVARVGNHYFVQTPNFYFPLEPHWVFPFFQFLPLNVRISLTQRFQLGHIGRIKDRMAAEKQVREVRLLTRGEMKGLFPDARIYNENILLFTKSIVAYRFPYPTDH